MPWLQVAIVCNCFVQPGPVIGCILLHNSCYNPQQYVCLAWNTRPYFFSVVGETPWTLAEWHFKHCQPESPGRPREHTQDKPKEPIIIKLATTCI